MDVLAVAAESGTKGDQQAMGEAVVGTAARCPGTGLEMSVIAATAASLGSCPFEVHVRASATETAIIPGADLDGDTDLVLHCAVCRAHAPAVYGPPAAEVFGPVPADRVGVAMVSQLQWALEHGGGEGGHEAVFLVVAEGEVGAGSQGGGALLGAWGGRVRGRGARAGPQ
ncbi:hypothetical protein GCM10011428_40600 [Streptomyces violaceus]